MVILSLKPLNNLYSLLGLWLKVSALLYAPKREVKKKKCCHEIVMAALSSEPAENGIDELRKVEKSIVQMALPIL